LVQKSALVGGVLGGAGKFLSSGTMFDSQLGHLVEKA